MGRTDKISHQHMSSPSEPCKCPVKDCRFGLDYESLKPNKHDECPNCLKSYNHKKHDQCLDCQKKTITMGWWNVTCDHLTGRLAKIRKQLQEIVDVKPSVMSQQELKHLSSIMQVMYNNREYFIAMTNKLDHRSEDAHPIIRE